MNPRPTVSQHHGSRRGAAGRTHLGSYLPWPLIPGHGHIQGQGKTIEPNAKLSNHRELWVRPDTVQKTRQNSSTEAPRPGRGGGPASSQYLSHLPVPSPGPFALRPSCLLWHSPSAGGGWAPSRLPATSALTGSSPFSPPQKGAGLT